MTNETQINDEKVRKALKEGMDLEIPGIEVLEEFRKVGKELQIDAKKVRKVIKDYKVNKDKEQDKVVNVYKDEIEGFFMEDWLKCSFPTCSRIPTHHLLLKKTLLNLEVMHIVRCIMIR